MFGSRLALAYYLVPSVALIGNVAFVAVPELKLAAGEQSRARLSAPLPPSARCVRWDGVEGLGAAPAGGRLKLAVRVTNCGPKVWPDDFWAGPTDRWGAHAVRFGARWTSMGAAANAPFMDWRQSLPHAVLPGERLESVIYVPAPAAPGRYMLEIDLVQELVAWFSASGAAPLRLGVEIR